jgi:DNA-binding response OmpR family regulator
MKHPRPLGHATPAGEPDAPPAPGRPTVLVVEDEYAIGKGLAFFFNQHGWDCTLAGTLREARRALDQAVPGWIVLDLMLTDGEGADVLAEVRRRGLACRVVVLTGAAAGPEIDRVRPFEPDHLLTKPVEFGELFDRMTAGDSGG